MHGKFKQCYYLQSQKVWAGMIQNQGLFEKNLPLALIVYRPNILEKVSTFFLYFSMVLSKAPTSYYKKSWNNFCCTVFLFVSVAKVYLIFLKFNFKLEMLVFLSFEVSFLLYIFKWKVVFLAKKPTVKYETYFCGETVKFKFWWQKLELCKVVCIEKPHCYWQLGYVFNSRKSVMFLISHEFNYIHLLMIT